MDSQATNVASNCFKINGKKGINTHKWNLKDFNSIIRKFQQNKLFKILISFKGIKSKYLLMTLWSPTVTPN